MFCLKKQVGNLFEAVEFTIILLVFLMVSLVADVGRAMQTIFFEKVNEQKELEAIPDDIKVFEYEHEKLKEVPDGNIMLKENFKDHHTKYSGVNQYAYRVSLSDVSIFLYVLHMNVPNGIYTVYVPDNIEKKEVTSTFNRFVQKIDDFNSWDFDLAVLMKAVYEKSEECDSSSLRLGMEPTISACSPTAVKIKRGLFYKDH